MLEEKIQPVAPSRARLAPAHRRVVVVWVAVSLWAAAVLLLIATAFAPAQPTNHAPVLFPIHLSLEDLFPQAE